MLTKRFLLLILLLLPIVSSAQSLKKKYIGVYRGSISAYVLSVGNSTLTVDAASIVIAFSNDQTCVQTIGNDQLNGTWSVVSETKTTYTIEMKLNNQVMLERCVLEKKSKKLLREGFYPQPDALLDKQT